jgi:hypothetical protein
VFFRVEETIVNRGGWILELSKAPIGVVPFGTIVRLHFSLVHVPSSLTQVGLSPFSQAGKVDGVPGCLPEDFGSNPFLAH